MTEFLIILIGLWTYPVISIVFLRLTNNKPELRKKVIIGSSILSIFAILGLLTTISTTLSAIDWFIVSTIYLTISLVLAWTRFQKIKIIKIFGTISMVFVFSLGYLAGTIGGLGVGLIVSEYSTEYELWLGNGIIYKENSLGNAISDHRVKKVEIYKTISWLPLFEWKTEAKEFNDYLTIITTPLTIEYKPENNKIYLSASKWSEREHKYNNWSDSLTINK